MKTFIKLSERIGKKNLIYVAIIPIILICILACGLLVLVSIFVDSEQVSDVETMDTIETDKEQSDEDDSVDLEEEVLGEQQENKIENNSYLSSVVRVIDGDTIEVDNEFTIRLIGIDTPEIGGDCYAEEAKEHLEKFLLDETFILQKDELTPNKDIFDRYLRYILIEDENINRMMIQQGYADVYKNEKFVHRDDFIALAQEAKENELGMWDSDNCEVKGINNENDIDETQPTPSPTVVSTPLPTQVPVFTPVPTEVIQTPVPQVIPPTQTPYSPGYVCDCKKVCSQMSSCDEAYYQLNQCGCSIRDGDNDGIPCESICR